MKSGLAMALVCLVCLIACGVLALIIAMETI